MKAMPQISEAEFEVMKIIWDHAPVSTSEITSRLVQTTAWSPKTIQTLVKRLVNKGALTYEKQGRGFGYTPVMEKSAYLREITDRFLKRYYDGDISALLSLYMEDGSICSGLKFR